MKSIDTCVTPGSVMLVEAPAGELRAAALQSWLAAVQAQSHATWYLKVDPAEGPWSGLAALFRDLLPRLESHAKDLVVRYNCPLCLLLPELRERLSTRYQSLAERYPEVDRPRNYPADRSVRVINGLIDLLALMGERFVGGPWTIVVDGFDQAGALVTEFYPRLMRRRGKELGLTLVIATAPGFGEEMLGAFPIEMRGGHYQLHLEGDDLVPAVGRQEALALEASAGTDPIQRELLLPRVAFAWLASDEPQRSLPWLVEALNQYVAQGFYLGALPYGEVAMALLEQHQPTNIDLRWPITQRLFTIWTGLNEGLRANQLIERFLAHTTNPRHVARCCYYQALLWSRFMPERHYDRAASCLLEGLRVIEPVDDVAGRLQKVFLLNGLALVRVWQGRKAEALKLCNEADRLVERFLPLAHPLHRSAVLYNSAQAHAGTGQVDEAIRCLGAAIELDPHYVEHYNERGALYRDLGRLTEAELDFRRAIEIAPACVEAWSNLGSCLGLAGRNHEALVAYGRALDLEPDLGQARMGRAKCLEELGDLEAAMHDYDALLKVAPGHLVARGKRAVLYRRMGRPDLAVQDLTLAVQIAPRQADLYQLRASVLADLGRPVEATENLRTYLHLAPQATDRAAIEALIKAMQETDESAG